MKISRSTKGIMIFGIIFILIATSSIVINLIFEKNRRENSVTVYNTSLSNGTLKIIDDNQDSAVVDDSVEEELVTTDTETVEETTTTTNEENNVTEETTVLESVPEYVYDGMTLEELTNKLDRNLKSDLSGMGYIYASYSLEKGVDPYLAVAISLHETGCYSGTCSSLVKTCNNVGGMRGTGSCGSWASYNTLEEGIRAYIDNIAKNYVAYGLTTADTMASKYAGSTSWAEKVNYYINKIKNS